MTILDPKQLRLEPRHIEEGLTPSELFIATGVRVKVHTLDKFPFWEPLAQGLPLSAQQEKARGKALTETLLSILPLGFAESTARQNVKNTGGFASSTAVYVNRFPRLAQSLEKTTQFPAGFAVEGTRRITATHRSVLRNEMDEIEFAGENAFIFMTPSSLASEKQWANLTNIPRQYMKRFPEAKLVTLAILLHELRHLMQANNTNNDELKFWNERDSDRYALSGIASLPQAKETTDAWVHARYLGMLLPSKRYWIAPSIEADLANRAPPSYVEVVHATEHLHRELYGASLGRSGRWISSKMPHHAIGQYKTWIEHGLKDNPKAVFPLLRKIAEDGSLDDKPLTLHIARKILAATEHFSPGLSRPTP